METNLSFEGFFLISSGSGLKVPDHHYLNSFKLWDPKTPAANHHFQESHREKALHEKLADKLRSNIADLIHLKTESTHVADWNEKELAENIQKKDF